MTKSKYLLLDANVVIDAHALGFWRNLLSHFKIALPSVVFHNEATYFHASRTKIAAIDLRKAQSAGQITVLEATISEIAAVEAVLTNDFFDSIDEGELEAIALLKTGKHDDYRFCSGDQLANKAMGVMDLGGFCVSLEQILREAGCHMKLRQHYSSARLQKLLADAIIEKSLYRK